MARPTKVSITQRGKVWWISFRKGKERIRESCYTTLKKDACEIQQDIIKLLSNENATVKTDRAHEIYFGSLPTIHPDTEDADDVIESLKVFHDDEEDEYIMSKLALENRQLKRELAKLKEDLEEAQDELEGIKQEMVAQRIIAAKTSPTLEDAIDAFNSSNKIDKKGQSEYKRVLNKFKEDREHLKASLITESAIHDYLEESAEDHNRPNYRYNYNRTYLSRFFSWCHDKYKFVNPMQFVKKKKEEQQGDIHYHDLDEVIEVIKNEEIESPGNHYWRNMIATFLYTGLSAHELRGIRAKDIIEIGDKKFIYVTPHEERTLKRIKRKRKIQVSEALMPYIEDQSKAGTEYLFKPTVGSREIWHRDTLSDHLNLHLKDDMNALSLRRTFGSLLLRSGRSPHEVAAAMGNSIEMVEKHYAKLLASEIDTNFDEKVIISFTA